MDHEITRQGAKHRRSIQIPDDIKERTGASPFQGTDCHIMIKGMHPTLFNIGISLPIKIRIKIRRRLPALTMPLTQIVGKRITGNFIKQWGLSQIIIRGKIKRWHIPLTPSFPDIMVKRLYIAFSNLRILTEIEERVKERIWLTAFTPACTQIMNQREKSPFSQIGIHQKIIISIKKP
jgi:hypothetical protein